MRTTPSHYHQFPLLWILLGGGGSSVAEVNGEPRTVSDGAVVERGQGHRLGQRVQRTSRLGLDQGVPLAALWTLTRPLGGDGAARSADEPR